MPRTKAGLGHATQPNASWTDNPVAARYDALFVDLDGVVYRGDQAVAAAPEALDGVRSLGIPVLFLTNNSSRTPADVATKLAGLGVRASPEEVLTSGMATAAMLRKERPRLRTAFVIGERGIREALEGIGIDLADGGVERTDLVVVGLDRGADYDKLRVASLLVERGARLVATNSDVSYPAPDGLWPGAGALLAAVTATTGATATVVGKPARPLFEAAAEMTGATNPLVVGDRLDTDIEGAARMGWDSMLVLSGAARPVDLLNASALPTYVAQDISALLDDYPPARFGPAADSDAEDVAALLVSAGLDAEGVSGRLDATLVTPAAETRPRGTGQPRGTGRSRIDATACLMDIGGVGLLRSVAVREEFRGMGLGLLAVAEAVRRARLAGMSQVALFTETAESFFSRLGFRSVDRSALPEGIRSSNHAASECAESAVAMLLDLFS